MRIDKLLSNLKYGSRKEIRQIIKNKQVKVNDEIIKDSSIHVDPNKDKVEIYDEIVRYKEQIYLMLNKPSGYLSATTDSKHRTVIDLLEPEDQVYDVFPCGRLDLDTEGLMILSNDGAFAHQLTHPKKEVYKTYYVEVEGELTNRDVSLFNEGMTVLDGQNNPYETKKAFLHILESGMHSKANVSISEGKFHQVKRMFQNCGKPVTYLKRIAIGQLELDNNLKLGQYKELDEQELKLLFINQDFIKEE